MSELKPCPFCGATTDDKIKIVNGIVSAVGVVEKRAPDWCWWVRCKPCAIKGTVAATEAAAIEAWNMRAECPDPPIFTEPPPR